MKKVWRRIVVFALMTLPLIMSTVGNLTFWPGKSGK